MDRTAFLLACRKEIGSDRKRQGIGTLGEKSVHAVLKRYLDPCEEHYEVKCGPYVADLRNEDGFFEIQTRGFHLLQGKLEFFLNQAPVTVVYPVSAVKWVIWLDQDGTTSPRRKSPKRPGVCAVLPELYSIKPLLFREGLRICIPLMEVEEYRLKNGRSEDGKKGAAKFDRVPITLLDEVWLTCPEDYGKLIPEGLPETFTAGEFGKKAGLSPKRASVAMNVLYAARAVERCGKRGNAYLYTTLRIK